ncbi:MAG TPA: diacylglycerol kinase family protein [Spirochaetia bacterium]|nr:diacylglycerol kinase family protein [Spirochaetia bacterium]
MSLLVIANPHAGRGRGARVLERVEEFLAAHGTEHETAVTDRAGRTVELAAQASREGRPAVVLVGGDGTLFEALNGMMREGRLLPVAQIPVGTGNSFIKDLGIETLEHGLAALAGGRRRRVDIGRVTSSSGQYHFVNLIGAGFVAGVAARASAFKLFGDASYRIGVFIELALLRSCPCRLRIDGREIRREAIFVEVCNSRKTGGDMIMAPGAVIDDGLFDVVIANAMNRRTLLRLFPLIFTGEHVKDPHVEVLTGARVELDFQPPQPVTPDGELLGTTPIAIEVVPRALEMYTR